MMFSVVVGNYIQISAVSPFIIKPNCLGHSLNVRCQGSLWKFKKYNLERQAGLSNQFLDEETETGRENGEYSEKNQHVQQRVDSN